MWWLQTRAVILESARCGLSNCMWTGDLQNLGAELSLQVPAALHQLLHLSRSPDPSGGCQVLVVPCAGPTLVNQIESGQVSPTLPYSGIASLSIHI